MIAVAPLSVIGPGAARSRFKGLHYSSYSDIVQFLRNRESVVMESRRVDPPVRSRVTKFNNLALVRGYSDQAPRKEDLRHDR